MFGRKKRDELRQAIVQEIKELKHEEAKAVSKTIQQTDKLHENVKRNGFHVEMLVAVGGRRPKARRA